MQIESNNTLLKDSYVPIKTDNTIRLRLFVLIINKKNKFMRLHLLVTYVEDAIKK